LSQFECLKLKLKTKSEKELKKEIGQAAQSTSSSHVLHIRAHRASRPRQASKQHQHRTPAFCFDFSFLSERAGPAVITYLKLNPRSLRIETDSVNIPISWPIKFGFRCPFTTNSLSINNHNLICF
jgi:hypothetical protein